VVLAALVEVMLNFAYGEVVPIPTISVVVASRIKLVGIHVQPPPDDEPPEEVIDPQFTFPEPSTCSAWLAELQFARPVITRLGTDAEEVAMRDPVVNRPIEDEARNESTILPRVEKKVVEVALVERRLGKVEVEVVVAVKYAETVSPTTESLAYGEVVPTPKFPPTKTLWLPPSAMVSAVETDAP